MNCPQCNLPLETHGMGEVLINQCAQCGGMWFDQGELGKAKDFKDDQLGWLDVDLWKDQDQFNVKGSGRSCPVDAVQMALVNYANSGIEVDHCVLCRGIWLDKGEFEKLLQVLHDEAAGRTASELLGEIKEEAAEVFTGEKSKKEEWNDLRSVMKMLQYRLVVENPKLDALIQAFYRSAPYK